MSHGLMDAKKFDKVIQSATSSVGVPMLELERQALMAIASEGQRALRAYTTARTALEKLSLQTSAQHMAPMVGKATAAVFSAFVGDPSKFPSASAYLKAFGMNLKEKSSGKFQGHLKLTKRGPGRARQYLWLAVCRWVRQDPVARAWYEKKIARDGGKKAKALVALMRKLAGALYYIGRGDPFDSAKLFDVKRLAVGSVIA
jgi:transposase